MTWINTSALIQKLLLFVIFVIPLQIVYFFLKPNTVSPNQETNWVKKKSKDYVSSSNEDIFSNVTKCSGATNFLDLAKLHLILIPILLTKIRSSKKVKKSLDSDIYMH